MNERYRPAAAGSRQVILTEPFKDFLLSRIISTRSAEASEVTDATDEDWQERVTLEIGPHPDLSKPQAKVIALDYGMRGGKVKIKVRRALLYYALKRLGLDTDPAARKAQDQQVVLINREEIIGGVREGGGQEATA